MCMETLGNETAHSAHIPFRTEARTLHICATKQIPEAVVGRPMSSTRRVRVAVLAALLFGIAAVSGLLATSPVAAHAHVMQGEYELTVGWRVEPAIVGSLNGLDLGIQDHRSNGTVVWVVGVETNLTAT